VSSLCISISYRALSSTDALIVSIPSYCLFNAVSISFMSASVGPSPCASS